MRFRYAWLTIAVLVVSSCVSDTDAPQISKALSSAKPETMGVVVMSIGALREDRPFEVYGLDLRSIPSKEEIFVPFNARQVGGTAIDFRDATTDAAVFAFKVPEGRYEIYNYFVKSGGMRIKTSIRLRHEISIPFDVKAGAVSYVGEFVGVPVYRRAGSSVETAGAIWVVKDQEARDIPRARQKLADAAFERVTSAVPDVAVIRSPNFVRNMPAQRIVIQ